MSEDQPSPEATSQPDAKPVPPSPIAKIVGYLWRGALLIVGGLLLFAFFDDPMDAPRAQIESQIESAIPSEPIVFFQILTEPDEEASSFGIVESQSGIIMRVPGARVPRASIDSAFRMAVGSHPVVATYGPDSQLHRLAIVSFPVVEDQIRDEQVAAVVAIADAVTPDEDSAQIRKWIDQTLSDYLGQSISGDDAMVVRRSFGPLRANITLSRKDTFVGVVRPGVEMIVGLLP